MRKALVSTVAVLPAILLLAAPWMPIVAARGLSQQSEFDKVIEQLQRRSQEKPRDPESWYNLAKEYADEARLNAVTLPRDVAQRYVRLGLENDEKALALNPVYYEALRLRDSLLRQRAASEGDAAVRATLLREAAAAVAKADELERRQRAGLGTQVFPMGP